MFTLFINLKSRSRAMPTSMGPAAIKWSRKDLVKTYGELFLDYVFEINSAKPVGRQVYKL